MTAWTRQRCGYALAASLVVVVFGGVALAQKDPMSGTWKLSPGGKYSPGPAPKSVIVTITAADTAKRKVTVDGVTGDGTAYKWSYSGSFDGKDNKVTGTNPDADAIALRRISPTSTESTYKQAGKVTLVNTLTVSEDGKTLTVVSTGTNAKGQKVDNSYSLLRQKGAGTD